MTVDRIKVINKLMSKESKVQECDANEDEIENRMLVTTYFYLNFFALMINWDEQN